MDLLHAVGAAVFSRKSPKKMGKSIWLALLLIAVWGSQFMEVRGHEMCRASPYVFQPAAKARFTVITSIRQSSGSNVCGDISASALFSLAAIDWAVTKINQAGYIPMLQLGFDVYDDCGLERLSAFSALDAMSSKLPSQLVKCYTDNSSCSVANSTIYKLGILGASRSQTTYTVLNAMKGYNIPVVGPYATLPELSSFDSFFRTTTTDKEQVKVIIQILKTLGWSYVAGLHTSDNYGRAGMQAILELARENNICFDVVKEIDYQLDVDMKSTDDIQNIFSGFIAQKAQTTNSSLGIVYFGQKNLIEKLLLRLNTMYPEYRDLKWVMSDFVGTSVDVFANANDIADQTLTVSSASVFIKDVKDHFFGEWDRSGTEHHNGTDVHVGLHDLIAEYKVTHVDKVSGQEVKPPWRNDKIMPTIDAVYVFATALKQTIQTKCPGMKILCNGFRDYFNENIHSFVEKVKVDYAAMNASEGPQELIDLKRVVQFDENGEIQCDDTSPLYDVNMYYSATKSFTKVGEYKNDTLVLFSNVQASRSRLSTCKDTCSMCISLPEYMYEYVDGEYLLLGFFSLHDSSDGYKCGPLRVETNDVIGMEAFLYSVGAIRNKTGINFGGIAFDDCYNPARGSEILNEFLSGSRVFYKEDGVSPVDPSRVVVVIGPYPSGVTVPLTHLFTRLDLVSISYASSSPDLDDRINYPYFLRTVPSDVTQVNAMADILAELKWSYVGTIHIENNYGNKGKLQFEKKAAENNVCVGLTRQLPESPDDKKVNDLARELALAKENVFIYYGTETMMYELLGEMDRYIEEQNVFYNFTFIASEDIAESERIKNYLGRVARGFISFKFDSMESDGNLDKFLNAMQPTPKRYNNWFRQYWREYFQCNPAGEYDKVEGKPVCGSDKRFSADDLSSFKENQRIVHIMNAVYAAGFGLKAASSNCPRDLRECDASDVLSYIQNIELNTTDNRQKFRVFDENGNGDVGFRIKNLQKTGTATYDYIDVGFYRDNSLTMEADKLRFYDKNGNLRQISGSCGLSCPCQTELTTPAVQEEPATAAPAVMGSGTDLSTAEIVIITLVSLCLVLVISLVVTQCRRRKQARTPETYHRYLNSNVLLTSGGNARPPNSSNGQVPILNPGGKAEDIKYLSGGSISSGLVNGGFHHSDQYIHPTSVSGDTRRGSRSPSEPGFSPLSAREVNYSPNPNYVPTSTPNKALPTQRSVSPPSQFDRQLSDNPPPLPMRDVTPTSSQSPRGSNSQSPRGSNSHSNGLPNLKQYQLPSSGQPRMGMSQHTPSPPPSSPPMDAGSTRNLINSAFDTSASHLIPGNDPVFSDQIYRNNGHHKPSPRRQQTRDQEEQDLSFFDAGQMDRRDRKSQFASLNKKRTRSINVEEELVNPQSVEKVSRV